MQDYQQIRDAQRERAKTRFRNALQLLNDAARELISMDIEPHVDGWTTPGDTGHIRCQGNSSVNFKDIKR